MQLALFDEGYHALIVVQGRAGGTCPMRPCLRLPSSGRPTLWWTPPKLSKLSSGHGTHRLENSVYSINKRFNVSGYPCGQLKKIARGDFMLL